jgi:hypothetical protein
MSSIADTYVATPTSATPAIRVGDVFGASWRLYRSRFGAFSLLAIVAYSPEALLTLLTPRTAAFLSLTYILERICSSFANAAIVYGVIQELRGQSFTFAGSMRRGFARLGPILGLSVIVSILAVLGFIFLIVPGFIVMAIYAVALSVCVAERAGVGASMRRSAYLTKGNRWRVFGIQLLIIVVSMIAVVLFSLAVGVGFGFLVGRIGGYNVTTPLALGLVQVLARYPVQVITGGFNAVAGGVLYYKLRVAREGVDIDKIAAVFD